MRYNNKVKSEKLRMRNYSLKFKVISSAIFAIFFLFPFFGQSAASLNEAEQQDLKTKINVLRNQIQNYQKEIYVKSQREETLHGDIADIEKDIAKIELQIQETQLIVQSLDLEIADKEAGIVAMQKEVIAKKAVLAQFMQELYEQSSATPVELVLGNETFSDYFFQADSIESFEERTREIYEQLIFIRDGIKKEREDLLIRKEEQMNLRAMQNDQQRTLDSQEQAKNSLLSQTKNEKQALSIQMDKLQEQLNALQTLGEPINIDEAISAAKYASGFTKVAPEFLLGVLRVESGLGTNVGGGRYKTDMNPAQWDTFKKICGELGVDASSVPVSRRACYNSDAKDGCGGWGGAMGPGQFMPATWIGYKSKVEKITGEMPANPWDLKDSLVAMGLKLAAVDGVTSGDRRAWAKAAAMYLAGGAWENYSWYSDRVLSYADGFKKIMK
jgi:peptidoglycan hydrolase CwlO-like protein